MQIQDFRDEVRVGAKRTGNKGQKAFERIVENWSSATRPEFSQRVEVSQRIGGVRLTIAYKEANPNKPIWQWINFTGTKAHRINPKPGNPYQRLFFMWGGPGSYEPKTNLNPARFGGAGVVRGGQLTVSTGTNHPGFFPRNFHVPIQRELEPDFKKEVYNGGRRGLRRAKRSGG
jgi:hypothetical protein